MKNIIRTLVLAVMLISTAMLFTSALAESRTFKPNISVETKKYTIVTGSKDAKLKLINKKGTAFYNYTNSSYTKYKTKEVSQHGCFEVTIQGGGTTITRVCAPTAWESATRTVTLKKNTTYTVTISYEGFAYLKVYAPWGYPNLQASGWLKFPSLKIDVNNSADIK